MDEVVIGLFVLLTGVIGYYWWREQQPQNPFPFGQVFPLTWTPQKLIEDDPTKNDFLTTFSRPLPPFEETVESIIVVQNPWEIRAAQGRDQIEQEALKLHNQAKAALESGNLDEAERLANRARVNKPNYPANQELLKTIAERRAAALAAQNPDAGLGMAGVP